ncbi:MAG: hypothetical protein R3284_11950 [Rubricoccaceae bacterium]|nr:hypothetical protein [Rubricoccaceae bacterium]
MKVTAKLFSVLLLCVVALQSAGAQIHVDAALAHDRQVEIGASYEGNIPITNTSDEAYQVRLYQTDYRFDANGNNWYDTPGTSERSNALWIGYGNPVVTVPAKSTLEVPYRVVVPDDTSLTGSYWSMLMVEAIPPESIESTLSATNNVPQFAIERRIRYGVQIATHVLATGSAVFTIDNPELVRLESEGAQLKISVENTGDRLAESAVYVDLFTVDGQNVGRFEGTRARLYPGTSFKHHVSFGVQAPGQYEALFVIATSDGSTYGAQFTLEL